MPNKVATDKTIEKSIKKLGKKLAKCRGKRSLRNISAMCGVSAPQLLQFENGTLAPTSTTYAKLIEALDPAKKEKTEMDSLFMTIRKTPPPDVCKLLIGHPPLISALQTLEGVPLTKQQINDINSLFESFTQENTKGDTENG